MNPRRLRGAAIGLVTDLNDPEQFGRIKVKFPWLHDEETSYWCRIVATQAGGWRGDFVRPELGDEVLVMFERGDAHQPCVVGVLWNGKDAPPGPGNGDGKNDYKFFESRSGHQMIFNDGSDGGFIQFHDCKKRLHTKFDVPGKHVHWLADSGTIQISAPEGLVRMECVDFVLHSTKDTHQAVTNKHDIKVTGTRTYKAKTLTQTAGSKLSVTTPNLSLTANVLTSSSGSTSATIGQMTAVIEPFAEMEFKGPVSRTVSASAEVKATSYRLENEHGPSGPLTISGAQISIDTGAMGAAAGGPLTVNGGAVSLTTSTIVIAKDSMDGAGAAKASIISLLGGTVLLNPKGVVGPSPKMLDMMIGADFHNQLPGVNPAPLPLAPHAFTLPLLIDTKFSVLVNCMPAATTGTTAVGVHIPPTYLPANSPVPMTYRMLINSAIVAVFVPAVIAAGTLAFGLVSASAAGKPVQPVLMAGASSGGEAAWRHFRTAFPMTQSWGAFVAFLMGLMPYPVANGSISLGAPNVTAEDAPLSLIGQMFSNSCSDIPIVPNAVVAGASNVLVGVTLGALLKQMAMRVLTGALTLGAGKLMNKVNPPTGGKLDTILFPGLQEYNPTVRGTSPPCRQLDANGQLHPVCPVTGTLFDKEVDAELPGPLPFKLERNYNSVAARERWGGVLGVGWRLNFESVLTRHYGKGIPKFWVLHDDELRTVQLPWLEEMGEWRRLPAEQIEFCRADEKLWDVRDRDGVIWRYEEHAPDRARLQGWSDRHGNTVRVLYHRDDDLAMALVDSAGRRIRLEYVGERLANVVCEGRDSGWTGQLLCAYRYDDQARLVEVERGDGSVRRFAYDDRNRMIRDVEAGGYTWSFFYDDLNRVTCTYGEDLHEYGEVDYQPAASMTAIADHTGRKRLFKYSENGRLTVVVDREGDATKYEYDKAGQQVAVIDPAGAKTEQVFDAEGRLVARVLPDGGKYTYTYGTNGQLVQEEDPCKAVTAHTYDVHGHRIRTRHPDGSETRRRFDSRGLLLAELRPDGTEHEYSYDDAGNLVEEKHDGTPTTHAYDPLGRRIRSADASGKVTRFTHDGRGRMTSREWPDGRVERWRYDPNGKLAEYIDRDGQSWVQVRDPMGREIERRTPEGRSIRTVRGGNNRYAAHMDGGGRGWRYGYDHDHRLVRWETDDGVVERYERDPAGHVIGIDYADGGWRKYENDAAGRQNACETRDGTRQSFVRDAMGRIVEAIETPAGVAERREDGEPQPGERRVALRRAADGKVLEEVGPFGRVRQRFAPGGHLAGMQVGEVQIEITRDHKGQVTAVRAPDGVYRVNGPLTTSPVGSRLLADDRGWALGDSEGRPVAAYEAEHDAGDRRTREKLASTRGYGWEHHFAFDRDGRLNEHYDLHGNRLMPDAVYGPGNRLESDAWGEVRYDARGRVTTRCTPEGVQRFFWDDLERLTEVEQPDGTLIAYRYDAFARLVERIEDRPGGRPASWRFHWCEHRLTGEDRPDGTRLRYLYLDATTTTAWAAWVDGPWGSGLHRLLTDERGAVIAATDAHGQLSWAGEYAPYGECQSKDRGLDQRLRLPGMWADTATGLYYNRFRWYAPSWGRYLSQDPWGISGGLSPYGYAEGDPIHRVDPLGLSPHDHGGEGGTGGRDGTTPTTKGDEPPVTMVDPATLRWTQTTAGGRGRADEIRQSMAQRGWDGPPIDVVRTSDGLTTVDHTRAAVALEQGVPEVPVRIHESSDPLPPDMADRPWNSSGETATTWGEAVERRGAGQTPPIGPTGSPRPPKLPKPRGGT